MTLQGRDLITASDLSDDEVRGLLDTARKLAGDGPKPAARDDLKGSIVANLFFEPSTRTRLSFEAAAHRMGASTIGFDDPGATSLKKGETLSDTIEMIQSYADLLVMRHPKDGSARYAAEVADIPVINAGDGSHAHPTQSLVDVYTIGQERGRISDNKVVLLGDLRYGRTTHSLALLLARFGNQVTCVAPPGLEMARNVLDECAALGTRPLVSGDVAEAVKDADVLYVTRIQRERFASPKDHARYAGAYRVDEEFLRAARDDLTILHPLPRVDEIAPEVDQRPGAAYFRQAANGVPVRMALLRALLKGA